MTELIKNFSELGKGDVGIAGGKGASLGEMTGAGILVPLGFVILSPAFEKFLEETLYPEILPKVDAQGILVQDGSQEIFLEEWVQDEQEAREGKHPRPELAHGMKKDHILLLADGRVAEMKLDGVQSFEDYLFRIVTSGLSPKTKRQ